MKKRIITIIAVFLTGSAVFNSKAIVPVPADSLLRLELAEDFALLEKNRIQTGLLLDYGVDYVHFETFNGVNVSDSSHVNMATMELILQSLRNTAVGVKPFGQVSNIISQMSTTFNAGTNPVGIVLYEYNSIKPTALAENLLTYSELNGVQDVYVNNVWQNPYESKVIAAFTPYMNVMRNQTVVYSFDSSFRFTNRNISSIQFDAGDGVGYRTVYNGGNVQVTYSTTGLKVLKLKIYYDGNQVAECRSNIDIEAPITVNSPSFVVDATQSFTASASYMGYQPSAIVSVKYSQSNTSGTLKKPVIVAEGFDPISNVNSNSSIQGKGYNTIESYYNSLNGGADDRDIVYIDWGNSAAPIQANADILRQVLTWVNSSKTSNTSNILIGESMGGLIARYALCTMESASTPHDVSVYVSHDTPHLGVNVPLGAVYAVQYYLNALLDPDQWIHYLDVLANVLGLSTNNTMNTVQEILALRNAPSVRQMLINYVDSDYQIDNSLHNTFMGELNQMGFPQGDAGNKILNLAFSNGGTNTFSNTSTFATVNVTATANIGIKVLLNILLPGIAYGLDIANLGLWGLIPGATTLSYSAHIYPFSANGITVFDSSCTYQKENFLGSISTSLNSCNYTSPVGIPIDIVNGSYYSIPGCVDENNTITMGTNGSITFRKKFMFVPTVSSLCYKNGNTQLSISDYNYNYLTNGVDFSQIPFDGYRFQSSTSEYHTDGKRALILWAQDCSVLALSGPDNPLEGAIYSVTGGSYSVSWSTSNSQIATISSNGVLHKVGFGTFDVIATVEMTNGKVQLKKTITIPTPTFPGFPTYVLNKMDMTLPEIVQDYYPFLMTAQPQGSTGSEFYSLFTYYWGEKIGSSPISWTTSSSLSYNTGVAASQEKTIYFKAYYDGQYSTTYSRTIRRLDMVVPMGMDGDGNMHFDDGDEDDPIHVKGEVGDYVYTYHIDSHTFWFDHEASARELCQVMLGCEDLVAQIKTLRPWGEEELLAIDFTRTDLTTEEVLAGIILIMYQDIAPE